jgi:hypothetical protein
MITIRSIYDLKTFRAFQRYNLKKIFILAYICALAFIGVGIWFAFTSRSSYIVYLISGILLPVLINVFYKTMELETINRNIYLRDTTIQIFNFNEEGFELEQISKVDTFKDKYTYKDILSIIKYKKYYFIYINRSQAFVINNLDYVVGNEQELDELFKKVKGERFIVKRNSKKRIAKEKKD